MLTSVCTALETQVTCCYIAAVPRRQSTCFILPPGSTTWLLPHPFISGRSDVKVRQPGQVSPRPCGRLAAPSIDGGHSLEVALHDFNFAACTVADGGIVTLDNVFNEE